MIIMALRKDGNSRSSASYKPYDPSNSFVKKMTNTVTGLFGWRSNLQSGNQRFIDVSGSSSEDDRIAPAAKRLKVQSDEDKTLFKFISSAGKGLQDTCSPIKPVDDVHTAGPSNKNKCVISSTPAVTIRRSPVFSNTLDQSSSKRVTQNGEDSQADISTTLPQFNVHQRHNVTVPSLPKDVPNILSRVDANKSVTGSFSSTNSRRPSFNVDVFSSSSRRLSLSVCESRNKNCLSPFYSARTMYGGASALLPYGSQSASRMRSASTSKLDVFSPRSQITMQPVPSPSKLNDQEILSASARRILDSLEKYCSPVADAKRIPLNESSRKSNENTQHSLNRGVKRKLPTLNQMLPSTSELLRIKRTEKIQDSVSSAKQTVSSVPESSIVAEDSDSSSDSAELDYSVLSQASKDSGSQYVGKLTRKNESKFDDRPKAVHLPNAMLKISNLPKFDLTDEFVFSKPLLLENLDEKIEESTMGDVAKNNKSTPPPATNSNPAATTSAAETPSNGFGIAVSTTISASTLKNTKPTIKMSSSLKTTGSSLPATSKPIVSNNTLFAKSNNNSSSKATNWTCMKCFTMNIADECSKCSQSRPQKVQSIVPPASESDAKNNGDNPVVKTHLAPSSWGDKFKPPSDTWACTECLVRNKNTSTECVACGKTKNNVPKVPITLSAGTGTSTLTNSSGSGFDWKKFSKPAGWNCSNCYVQNKETDTKCAACEQSKEPSQNDATANKESPKSQFSFGIDKSGATPSFSLTNSMKFGSPADKAATSISFGSSSMSATSASTSATFTFGVKTSSASETSTALVSNGEGGGPKNAAPTPTFTFGIPKSTAVETSISSASLTFKTPMLSTTAVFSSPSDGEKPTEKKENSSVFNDVSSTSNSKNPLFANDSSVFKMPKLIAPKTIIANSQENGEENSTSNTNSNSSSTNLFNDISSSTEAPKKKVSLFSSVLNSNELSNDLGMKINPTVPNGGANVVSSSSNVFVTSLSTSAFTPAPSKLANDTHLSFATATAATSKADTMSPFSDKSGASSKLFSSQTNNFSNVVAPTSNPATLMFGNNVIGIDTNALNSATTAAVKSSEAPMLTSISGGTASSSFPSFSFGASANAAAVSASVKSSEMSLTGSAPPPSFASVAAPSQSSIFSFGANTAPVPALPTQQSSGGGFMFNGPKTDDSAPKFRFGAVNATPFDGAGAGAAAGASTPFVFSSPTPAAMNAASSEHNERPVANSLFGGIAAAAVANKTPAAETPAMNANPISGFGGSVFGATPSQPANPVKKSGGFSFNAASQFAVPTVNNFSNFTNPAANQEQKPAASTFVFGSSTNQTPQTHNFNPTIPPTFNFSGGNPLITFSAQPSAPNATSNACGPQRKIKKAVRRTTQK